VEPPAPRTDAETAPKLGREFGTLVDIIIAPARAFATIAGSSPWVVAYLVSIVLAVAGIELAAPALLHVETLIDKDFAAKLHSTPRFAAIYFFDLGIHTTLDVFFSCALTALVLTFSTKRDAVPRRLAVFFSLALFANIPSAIGQLLTGIATALRPAASYDTLSRFVLAFPDTLAVLVPHGSERELSFLGSVDAFTIWSTILVGLGYASIAKLPIWRGIAIAFAITFAILVLVSLNIA